MDWLGPHQSTSQPSVFKAALQEPSFQQYIEQARNPVRNVDLLIAILRNEEEGNSKGKKMRRMEADLRAQGDEASKGLDYCKSYKYVVRPVDA